MEINEKLRRILLQVKERTPLVHHITNYVTVNDCANIVLALGGSPVMADDEAEVEEMVSIASALVINIGTLNSRTINSMMLAGKKANDFRYFRSQEELLTFVQDTAILIQVTGPNKGEIMDRMYSGSLQSRTGDLYAMIPIKPQGAFGLLYTTSAKDLDDATFNMDEL